MRWVRHFFSRQRRYEDLSLSIREHIEEAIEDLMDRGMSRSEAERSARRQFGNVSLVEERSREVWQWSFIESILADIRFAWRQRLKSRGMTAIIILTLALGISAATSVFSVAYGVLGNPFPYRDVATLAAPKLCASEWDMCATTDLSPEQFVELQQHTTIFQALTASTVNKVIVTGDGDAQQIQGAYVTANIFGVLGVAPLLGRVATSYDVSPGHEPVGLLSYRYWMGHFGGSPSVLGRVMMVNDRPRTIIGVMPPRFLLRGADIYLPIFMSPSVELEGQGQFTPIGRVRPEVTDSQAIAELEPIYRDFMHTDSRRFPKDMRVTGLIAVPDLFKSALAGTLHLLLAAVFVLLLIACVNVSSLLLADAVKREHEFALRASVGASRLRLVRQVMIESLLLAVLSIPLALVFSFGGLQVLLRLVPPDVIPLEAHIALNIQVLAASLAFAIFTVVLAGMSPAWHSANPHLSGVLTGTRATGSRSDRRLLNGFVVSEIALSLALLALSGLMTRSMIAMQHVPILFEPDHTVMMRVPLTPKRYKTQADKERFFGLLVDRISHIPGVTAATVDSEMPLLQGYYVQVCVGAVPPGQNEYNMLHLVMPTYLGMSGLSMREGHFIDDREVSVKANELVVSVDFAKRHFPDRSALGQTVHLVNAYLQGKDDHSEPAFTIVGVISELPAVPGYRRKWPDLFAAYSVAPNMDTVVATTSLPAKDLVQPIRHTVTAIDPDQPSIDAMSLRQLLDRYSYASARFASTLFGLFAGSALLLSMIGIYGVFSFATSRRSRELGIRVALGAARGALIWMVLRQVCKLAAIGIALGLPLAFIAGHLARAQLFHTSQYDPTTFLIVVSGIPLLAIAATWLPAWRAATVDPVEALRKE